MSCMLISIFLVLLVLPIQESLSQYVVGFILYMYIWFLLKVKYSVNYYVFQICKKIIEVFHLCDHLMQHSTLPNLSRYLAQKNRRYSYQCYGCSALVHLMICVACVRKLDQFLLKCLFETMKYIYFFYVIAQFVNFVKGMSQHVYCVKLM